MGSTDGSSNDSGGYTFQYEPDDPCEPVATICNGVAWVTDDGVAELEPLAHTVDPDALLELFHGDERAGDFLRSTGGQASESPTMTFEYQGCLVTVDFETVVVERTGDDGP